MRKPTEIREGSPPAQSRAGRLPPGLAWLPLLFLGLQGCAYLGNPQAVLNELGPREGLPAAWEISGGGGASLYVLGAIHMGPAPGWEYPPGIDAAFDKANALVVEVNVAETPGQTIRSLIGHYGRLPPGQSLQRSLSPSAWSLLNEKLAGSGIPMSEANQLRPWLLSNLIIMRAVGRRDYYPEQGSEEAFIRRAGSRSIVPLESPSQQIAFLGTLSKRVQELYLVDTLNHYGDLGDYVDLYVDAWRSGDERALEKLIFDDFGQEEVFAPFFDAIIFKRNERMGKQLKVLLDAKQHAGESVFVVLGIAHLVGDKSIIADLEHEGYVVRRVTRPELREVPTDGDSVALHP